MVISNEDTISDTMKSQHSDLLDKIQRKLDKGKFVILNNKKLEWEDTDKGVAFCQNLYGGDWVQTSYNGNIRKQYAGIGYTYDPTKDLFISPQPFRSWKLDSNSDWQAPVLKPDGDYNWDETNQSWIKLAIR